MRTGRRGNLALALIGLGSAGLYALLAVRYPLAPSLAKPRAGWIDLAEPSSLGLAYHVAIYLGLTVLFLLAMRLLLPRRMTPTRKASADALSYPLVTSGRPTYLIILLIWLACSAILMTTSPGGESHDVFDYIFRGRMMAELGANPLTQVPGRYNRAPYFLYIAWHRHVDTYGPVWEGASAATAAAAGGAMDFAGWRAPSWPSCPVSAVSCRRLIGYVTAYRLLAVGLTGLSAALIASMVRRNRPHLAGAALAAWLWSPLLLISTAVGAHNDAVMMALLLSTLWLLQRRRWFLALLTLVLATHVKLTALIVLIPVALWLVRRCGWRRAIRLCFAGAVAGLLLSALLYAPFGGWASLRRMLSERAEFVANSPWRVLYNYLTVQREWPVEEARRLTSQVPTVLSALGAVLTSLWMLDFRLRRWKATPAPDWSDDRLLWRAIAAVALLYLLVGSFWFQHWYVVWVLAPAVLLPDSPLTRSLLPWLGFGALAANAIAGYAPVLTPVTLPGTTLPALMVTVIWGPLVVAGAWWLVLRRVQNLQRPSVL